MNSPNKERVLVLGATGMLGNAVLRFFAGRNRYRVVGSVRSTAAVALLPRDLHEHLVPGVDVENFDSLTQLFASTRPHIVVNCIGVVKQLAQADDPLVAIPVNSLLPHRVARLCAVAGARFIHVSTDCVFSGSKGMYREDDFADAKDLYGRSKLLGEVDYPHAVTLRTSIIGHELDSVHGLIGWFLSQKTAIRGYRKAIFSGVPTVELARVMHDYVLPRQELSGLYHVSASPINKYELLQQVAREYGRQIDIAPDDTLVIDRSLDSGRFRSATGYAPADWPTLLHSMHQFG